MRDGGDEVGAAPCFFDAGENAVCILFVRRPAFDAELVVLIGIATIASLIARPPWAPAFAAAGATVALAAVAIALRHARG